MQVKSACLGLYLAGFNVLPILVVRYEEGKIVYPQVWEVAEFGCKHNGSFVIEYHMWLVLLCYHF